MRQCSFYQKSVVIGICCAFILSTTILPVQAARRSNGLAITLFVTGIGLKVGSTFLQTAAQNSYEDYLAATIQADIQNFKSDAVTRQNASTSMSRVGYGFIGLATVISIFNQLHNASIETTASTQLNNNANGNGQFPINFAASQLLLGNDNRHESKMFSLLPNYDFQRQRVSLQFLHRF